MPKGPGTYGKKRGRPPKKPIRGYAGGGLVKNLLKKCGKSKWLMIPLFLL